jgi:hypothetical protein
MMLSISPQLILSFVVHNSHFRDVYTTPFQTGAAAVPPPLCRSGRFERLRGNDGGQKTIMAYGREEVILPV